ncbi:MAG: PAS domain S-box protein [Chitinophagaceae bacterium]
MRSIIAEVAAPEINQSLSRVFTVITDLQGNTLSVNDLFFRAMDMPREKLFSQPFTSFFPHGDLNIPGCGLSSLCNNNDSFECKSTFHIAGKDKLRLKWTVTQLHVKDQQEAVLQWTGVERNQRQKNIQTPSAQEIYKWLFDDSPQPMWIYDRSTMHFLDVNRSAIAHYGYSKNAFLDMTIKDIRPESEWEKFLQHLHTLSTEKVKDKTIWVHQKKNGALMYVEVQSYNFHYSGKDARLVIVNDVTQKEQIQKILQESEERFRNMADNAPVMIWVSDENDKTTYVNKYWTDFTGIDAAAAWGDGWDKVIHPGDIHIGIGEYKKGFQEKKPVSLIYRLKYRTGEYRWVLDKSIPRFLDDGTFLGYIGSLVDIHDYKMAEEKISFQARLIENASDVIISTGVNFNVVTWNKKAEDVYGITAKDAVTKNIRDLLSQDFLGTSTPDALLQLKEKGHWQGEVLHKKGSDEITYLLCMVSALRDPDNNITGYILVNRDITEKIKAEEAVRRNELKFKAILQNLMDVVFVLDKAALIKYVTPSVTAVLGYTEEELAGRIAFDFIHPDDLQRTNKLFDELLDNPGSNIISDIRLRNKKGSWSWVEAKGINKFTDSVINGIIISLHDISERKQSEQQLQAYSGHITSILNSITDGFIALDHKYNILWWNPIAEQLTGVKDVEVLGKNLWKAFPELKKIKNLNRYQKAITAKKAFSFEMYIPKLKVYFDISAYPSQQGLFIYFKDITPRKKQQMLLSLEKEVLELNINADASLKNTVDYFLSGMEKFNPGLICSVLLLDEDGKSIKHLSSPSLAAGFIKKINGLQVGPEAGSCGTAIFLRKTVIVSDITEDPLWRQYKHIAARYKLAACWSFPIVTSSNKVLGSFAGYYREKISPSEEQQELFKRVATLMGVIIENKQAEQKINISNERYMLATKATNDAIWDYDIKSKRLYWGESFYSIFGYTPGNHLGKHGFWESNLYPEDKEKIKKLYENAIKNKERGVLYSEYRFRKADNTYVLVADRAFIIWDKDGHAIRFVGAMQDITDRKKLEGQLLTQEINKQKSIAQAVVDAQEKERAEIGKELHDNVNQILSTAKLYLELAKTDTRQKDALIKKSADSIFTAINEIRHISKALVPPSVKDLGLIESINDLVESLRMTTVLQVQFNHAGDFDNTIDDKQKLMLFRIIQEQVSNVLKHAAASHITISLRFKGKLINLSIIDDGKGFELEKVKFKKGVGLTNIESRAHLFNGEVIITTAPGKGCKLFIQVPIHNI